MTYCGMVAEVAMPCTTVRSWSLWKSRAIIDGTQILGSPTVTRTRKLRAMPRIMLIISSSEYQQERRRQAYPR